MGFLGAIVSIVGDWQEMKHTMKKRCFYGIAMEYGGKNTQCQLAFLMNLFVLQLL